MTVDLTAAHGDDGGDAIATVLNGRMAIPTQQTARLTLCTLTVQSTIGTTASLVKNIFFIVINMKCRTPTNGYNTTVLYFIYNIKENTLSVQTLVLFYSTNCTRT
jgi:hypothetical protein